MLIYLITFAPNSTMDSGFFMNQKLLYTIIIHVVVVVWGYTGIMGKTITLEATEMVWWRMLLGALSIGLLFPLIQKNRNLPDKKTLLKIIGVGGIVGLHWITFFESIKMSSVSLGIICLATTTIHVSWLEPIMKKTRFRKTDLLLSIIVLCGMLLVGSQEGANLAAIFVGLLSAFFAAFFSVSNAVLVEKTPATQLTLLELSSGFVLISLFLLSQGKITSSTFELSSTLFWQLLFLGVICTGVAFVLAVNATKVLGAFTVSLTINLEPVYTMILAVLYFPHTEKMTPQFYMGAAIILFAVIGNSIWKNIQKRKGVLSQPDLT